MDFRNLLGVEGIFNGKLMEIEAGTEQLKLVSIRIVNADPYEFTLCQIDCIGLAVEQRDTLPSR